MAAIKVGLIGCGRIAQLVHLKVLARLPGAELVAFAESDPERRQEVRRHAPKATAFDSYQELLKMTDIKAVVICLPPALHAEAAIAAFEAGKHVYLEKPIATNLIDARAVVETCRSSDLVGIMGYNYRFHTLYQAAKQYIQSGQLGDLVGVRTVFSSAARELPDWKQVRRNGGGVLLDLASHHVDLISFLFDEDIVEVSAGLRSQHSECDTAVLQMRLANDLPIQSFFSISAIDEDRFEIYGQAGKLMLDRYNSTKIEITAPAFEYGRLKRARHEIRMLASGFQRIVRQPGEPSYQAALSAFVTAVHKGNAISPNLEDGYRCLSVIEAAEESAGTGRVVSLKR